MFVKISACCKPFGNLLDNAGDKGIAIVPRIYNEVRAFYIQARPFEISVVEKLSAIDPETGINNWPSIDAIIGRVTPFVSVLSLPIKFCPSCGASLQHLIESDLSAFDEDAKNAEFLWSI